MKRILAITVGGEPMPVITSVKRYQPDFVLFFATTEPQGGSRRLIIEKTEKGESIVTQTGLRPDCYKIVVITHPDDLDDCYQCMCKALHEFSQYEKRIADYTGGTKSMSIALALAALTTDYELSLVTGPRKNLIKVLTGTETAVRATTTTIRARILLEDASLLYKKYEYAGAAAVLEQMLQLELPPDKRGDLIALHAFLKAIAAWDRFFYDQAQEILQPVANLWPEGMQVLAAIRKSGSKTNLGYVAVADLVGNAQRRAEQGRFDDAVLRLYRAVELLAQLRLKLNYDLDTADLDLSRLPEKLVSEFAKRKEATGKAWAGFLEAFLILHGLNDPLGNLYHQGWKERLKDLQQIRNSSFLEHGLNCASEGDWKRALQLVHRFLSEAEKVLKLKIMPVQFPTWDELINRCPGLTQW